MNIGYTRASDPGRYGAVILAAGLSSRMKEFKPLLPVDGRPAAVGLAETLRGAGIDDIIIVTGHRREDLQEVIRDQRLIESFNEKYESGMFSSIQAGLAKAGEAFPGKKGYFLVPVDCPLITIRAIRLLMTAADESTAAGESAAADENAAAGPETRFFVPTFEGKKGHPLLVPASRVSEIVSYDGDGGLKGITDRCWDQMVRVPVPDEEILLDMDTPEHYEAIRRFVSYGCQREKLEVLSSMKRIILVRHGETEQHEEPMFIGQYDVPLSDEGRKQAMCPESLWAGNRCRRSRRSTAVIFAGRRRRRTSSRTRSTTPTAGIVFTRRSSLCRGCGRSIWARGTAGRSGRSGSRSPSCMNGGETICLRSKRETVQKIFMMCSTVRSRRCVRSWRTTMPATSSS